MFLQKAWKKRCSLRLKIAKCTISLATCKSWHITIFEQMSTVAPVDLIVVV
jgi:hypothetical protein